MILKTLPIEKSIVTDVNVHVTDLYTKIRALKVTKSIGVEESDKFITADATLSTTPIVLSNIRKVILISAFQPFRLILRQGAITLPDMPCTGLFVFYGAVDQLSMFLEWPDHTQPEPKVRVSYQYI